jgi:hypothetical protein
MRSELTHTIDSDYGRIPGFTGDRAIRSNFCCPYGATKDFRCYPLRGLKANKALFSELAGV